MKRQTLGLGLVMLLALACGDDDGGSAADGGTETTTDDTTEATEATEPTDVEPTAATDDHTDHETDIPDGHEIPEDASAGAVMCAELAAACHAGDDGSGDLADECHDIGHLGDVDECEARYDECMAFCMGGDGGAHEHEHAEPIELTADDTIPGIALMVEADAMSGWNVHVELTDFELAPQNASTEHVDGEGHMHLYVDGVKLTRVYGEWFYLGELLPGAHELRMELSANSHAPFSFEGELIDDTVMIEQPEHADDHTHEEGETFDVDAADAPSVELDVHVDPKSGWNLEISTAGFLLAPENASLEHVDGEGHMHLYVDGIKQTRVYSDWYYLSGLSEGEHEVAIELSTNDHRAYAIEGEPIWGVAHVMVSEGQASGEHEHTDAGAHEHAADAGHSTHDAGVAMHDAGHVDASAQ